MASASSAAISLLPRPLAAVPGRRPSVVVAVSSTSARTKISAPNIVRVDKADVEKTHRLQTFYLEKVIPLLKEEFSYTNIHQVPKIEKVVVNSGMGDAQQNSKGLDAVIKLFALITGQRPVKTKARCSIAAFKLRQGAVIGMAVTLRGKVMYAFLDRLINIAFPRTMDFQGLNPGSFDGNGNYSVGMSELTVFPEIEYELIAKKMGMDVCITTTAKSDKEGQRLLAHLGMPFKEESATPVVVRKKKYKKHHFAKGKGRR